MSLYNEMRPARLCDVKGQDKVIRILKENLSQGHLPNAMLFVGTRGTGKTTVAKILAKQLNCENPLSDGSCCNQCSTCLSIKAGNYIDVLELDAASNNGVDHVRDLIAQIQYKPIGKKKVVILDEVHMLSTGAFNALLKIMEEPPAYVLFILCTTELHKIPATILSRCRKFQFETISEEMILEKLEKINKLYHLSAESQALLLVAGAAKGSLRDAESIYENFLDAEDGLITEQLVRETLGYSSDDVVFSLLEGILDGDPSASFEALQKAIGQGSNLTYLLEECFRILMDLITIHMGADITHIAVNEAYLSKLSNLSHSATTTRLFDITDAFKSLYEKRSGNLELLFQTTIVSVICRESTITTMGRRIELLEQELCTLRHQIAESRAIISAEKSPQTPGASAEKTIEDCKDLSDDIVTNRTPDTLSDSALSAELSDCGFTFVESSPFDGNQQTATKEKTDVAESTAVADESVEFFSDFARLFPF